MTKLIEVELRSFILSYSLSETNYKKLTRIWCQTTGQVQNKNQYLVENHSGYWVS